jgi:hypothetical protein
MTIEREVVMTEVDPRERIGCTLRRTPDYALHVRFNSHLSACALTETVTAVGAQLVLVPRYVVLQIGRLPGRAESHALVVGAVVALVHKAGIPLRIVIPNRDTSELLSQIGVLPTDRLFSSLESAIGDRA